MQSYYEKTLRSETSTFDRLNADYTNQLLDVYPPEPIGQKVLSGLLKVVQFIGMLPGEGAVLLFTILHATSLFLLGNHQPRGFNELKNDWLKRIGVLGAISYYFIEYPLECMVHLTENYKKEISIAFWVALGLAAAAAVSGGVMAAFFPAAFAELVSASFLGLSIAAVAETAVAQVALFAGLVFAAADILALALVPVCKEILIPAAEWAIAGVRAFFTREENKIGLQEIDESSNEQSSSIGQLWGLSSSHVPNLKPIPINKNESSDQESLSDQESSTEQKSSTERKISSEQESSSEQKSSNEADNLLNNSQNVKITNSAKADDDSEEVSSSLSMNK